MAQPQKHRPSSSGILLFIVGFLGCLLLCAAGGYVWVRVAQPSIPWLAFLTDRPAAPTTPTEDESLYKPSDRFTHAVYITDDAGQLQSLTLVMVCPDTQSIAVAGIPTELYLSDTDEKDTLLRRFRVDGVDAANASLAVVFPSSPRYYTVISYKQTEALFEAFDTTLKVSLPKDVDESASDGSYSVHLSAGDHALTPRQVTNLMRCTNWQQGRRERADIHALLVQSYLDQFVTDKHTLSADYKQLCTQSATNLSEEQFSAVSTVWQYLAMSQQENSPSLLTVNGIYEGAGSTLRFTLSTERVGQIEALWQQDPTLPTAAP